MSGYRFSFDGPEGRALLDVALCRLGEAKSGDILVIRHNEWAVHAARQFRDELVKAARTMPKGSIKAVLPVVLARDGVDWALESMRDDNKDPGCDPKTCSGCESCEPHA